MPRLFRAMKEGSGDAPETGSNARAVGVRPGIDVQATLGHQTVYPGQGGISVSPDDPMNLPSFRRPQEFRGTGKDPVWEIDEGQLGPDLCYRPDPVRPGHGFIEPARPMTLDEYERAVLRTRDHWDKVQPPADEGSAADAT